MVTSCKGKENGLNGACILSDPFEMSHFDLVTPDGSITKYEKLSETTAVAEVFITKISQKFIGFNLDPKQLFFNIKSTLAQLGLNGTLQNFSYDKKNGSAQVKVLLTSIGPIAKKLLDYLQIGVNLGKLFAADDRRLVRDPEYLGRMFGRSDRLGRPLLSLGGLHGSRDLILEKVDGRCVAYLTLLNGRIEYDEEIYTFLPTLVRALIAGYQTRDLLKLHQIWKSEVPRNVEEGELLLVKTHPLHIRTVFAKVVDPLLSQGYKHTSADILQPDTSASGDIYELYGHSKRELTDIPLEFYTLEPYREHIFFSDRDKLKAGLENPSTLFAAFATAPEPLEKGAAVFVVKGEQLIHLKQDDWIAKDILLQEFPGSSHEERQAMMVERYIQQQPSYLFLKAISEEVITSQGVLLTRYFPSPLLKRLLLSDRIQRCLKGIYFQYPSRSGDGFFSAEDRTLLNDLNKFGIPVSWVDETSQQILRYTQKPDHDSGLFVPLNQLKTYLNSTTFGVYGSNLLEGDFEHEMRGLLSGILHLRNEVLHPLLNKDTPIALITGGGPGAMEVGNRVAKELGILSCGNIVDFRNKSQSFINEQLQNPYIEAKMTYRIDKLVERQSEFNLDFPIFLKGGIGTDFEFSLEEVRRKVGAISPNPVILFGDPSYWREKITHRFQSNLKNGTIKGSEWVSNCFYCVKSATEALQVYKKFFTATLPIGKEGPIYQEGFVTVSELKH